MSVGLGLQSSETSDTLHIWTWPSPLHSDAIEQFLEIDIYS